MPKILAIDDNNDHLITLGAIVKDSFPDSIYDAAQSGKKGIELAISTNPDVILLDMNMPDMDGFEICRQLKQDKRVCDIPVVFLTASKNDSENRNNAVDVGGEAFLNKPIDAIELVAQIKAMVKIKEFSSQKRNENERLTQLVAERTLELEQSQAETLKLLQELKAEIATHKKTEEELRESEELFRNIFEYHTAVKLIIDPDTGNIIDANRAAETFYGWSKERLKHMKIQEINALSHEELSQAMERAKTSKQNYFEFVHRLADGSIRDVEVFSSHIEVKGKVLLHSIVHNISNRKQAEKALKENETKFRMLFTQMSEGFALHELIYDENHKPVDYKILDINPAFEKQVGIQAEKANGALATELYGVSPAPYLDIYAQVAETGQHQFFQTYFPPLDRHFQISIFSPKPAHFATVFTDITDAKRAEEALSKSEFQFKQLVNDMQVGVLLQGSQAEILICNPTLLELLGLTESQIMGKTSFDPDWNIIHEDGSPFPGSTHPVQLAIASRCPVRNVVMGVYRPTTHSRVWLQVDAEPQFNSQGMVQQVVCTFIDITERKHSEEALKENEARLRELNATKDKFFSIISHDLKNPFNSILGLSNLLVEQIQEKNYEGIEEYAKIIQKSSIRVFDLLLNLLEWSRSQTGRKEFYPEYIEMVSLINEVTELLDDSVRQKSITVFKELPRNLLIFADRAMISTILRNLISNAIKFTHPQGQITISAESKKDNVIIAISDNGVGIKNENIEKLFLIGENQTTPGTKNERGTGLGLILCKEFIEKHGGKIWVESEVGKGSKFYFKIPKT